MQSHNLQYAPARCALHFFHFVKERTSNSGNLSCPARSKTERRNTHQPCAHRPVLPLVSKPGGAGRDRTDDLRLAKPPLSQLSYSPFSCRATQKNALVGLVGFEPTTPALSRRCSNQLSYRPSHTLRGSSLEQPISCGYLAECSLFLLKGGDPAAPSDTATLLRLHPSHESHRGKRPPYG